MREFDESLLLLGTMRRGGWHASIRAGRPVSRDGAPIPWFSYPAMHWLDGVVRPGDRVWEYGAGSSTLWFGARGASVTSVESDPAWARRISRLSPPHVTVLERACRGDGFVADLPDPYVSAIEEAQPEGLDIVVIDGMARNTCVSVAPAYLRRTGLVIVDNAERPGYRAAISTLSAAGFTHISFVGPVPGNNGMSCTTVFARDWSSWLARSVVPTLS